MAFFEFSASNWLFLLTALFILRTVVNYARTEYLRAKLGCKPITTKIRYWDFGISFFFKAVKMKKDGIMVDYTHRRFIELGTDTIDLHFAGSGFVQTREPENVKAILATQFEEFSLGNRLHALGPLLGDGIFTLDGDGWKHSRAMLRPQFVREQISQLKALEFHVQSLAKHIDLTKGSEFDIQQLFFKLTLDSSTEFLFGQSVGSLQDENIGLTGLSELKDKQKFANAFDKSQVIVSNRLTSQNLYWLVGNTKEFRDDCDLVHQFADFYVQKALNTSPDDLEKISQEKGYIFLYELVTETRNPRVLRNQLLNILLAGRDTTAGLLSFTFFELARRPEMWTKLKEEVYQSFGSSSDANLDEINFESLKKCAYLKALLNEVLRLYPSVPLNFRSALKDTTLPRGGGPDGLYPIFVKKGTKVVYMVNSMHRITRYYGEDAEVFRPERWLTGETKKLGWAYLPFNGGPRICLGQQLALTQASYVIVRLCQLFPNIKSFDEEYPPRKSSYLTMAHQKGVLIGLS